jgi:hypothetical protein
VFNSVHGVCSEFEYYIGGVIFPRFGLPWPVRCVCCCWRCKCSQRAGSRAGHPHAAPLLFLMPAPLVREPGSATDPFFCSHSGSNCVRAPTVGSTLGHSRAPSAMSHAWLLADGAGMVSDKTFRRRFGKDLEGEPPPTTFYPDESCRCLCGGGGGMQWFGGNANVSAASTHTADDAIFMRYLHEISTSRYLHAHVCLDTCPHSHAAMTQRPSRNSGKPGWHETPNGQPLQQRRPHKEKKRSWQKRKHAQSRRQPRDR